MSLDSINDVKPPERQFLIKQARIFFLESVAKHAPKVISELFELSDENEDSGLSLWAKRHDLAADWVLEIARNTIRYQSDVRRDGKRLVKFNVDDLLRSPSIWPDDDLKRWTYHQFEWPLPAGKVTVECRPPGIRVWDPEEESRESYLSDVLEMVSEFFEPGGVFSDLPPRMRVGVIDAKMAKVQMYCHELANEYLEQHDEFGKQLAVPSDSYVNLRRDADWTARFQVMKVSYSRIGDEQSPQRYRTTIKGAVDDFLKLIELNRRETPRGGSSPGRYRRRGG